MADRRTFGQEKRARELFHEGRSCNAIARELGVAASTISAWAKREGLSFDRSRTALAVRARTLDIAATRTLLTQKLLAVADDVLEQLDGPYLVYAFGGRDNVYEEHLLDRPPMEAVRAAVTIARDAHVVATKTLESTPGQLEEAVSVLDKVEAHLDAEFAGVDDAEFVEIS